jgi:hypothetical protein
VKVYLVLKVTLLGPVQIVGVYADEIDALRAANESTMMRIELHEVIPAGAVSTKEGSR